MRPAIRIPLVLAFSFGFFCLLLYTIYNQLYSSVSFLIHGLTGISGVRVLDNTQLVFCAVMALAALFGVNLNQLLANRINIRMVKIELIIYFVGLFAIVLLKSRGIQELNLDISDFYDQLTNYPASVIINVLLFVPLGALSRRYIKSTPKALAIFLAAIVLIEVLQYALSLGIADVVDVTVNMAGAYLGYAAAKLLSESGWSLDPLGDGFVRIVRSRAE